VVVEVVEQERLLLQVFVLLVEKVLQVLLL
jgi:hypothetical protein